MSEILRANAVAVAALMLLFWLVSLVRRDASLVDRSWGFGFVVVAWTSWALGGGAPARSWLLAALTTIWGLRLALHLTIRNWGEGEDRRYQTMRAFWGADRFPWISLFTVFGLQGLLMWLVSLPVQAGQGTPQPAQLGALDAIGVGVWAIGLVFEVLGDDQLRRFKADPANRGLVMDRGLWRYTRHPNYFGDALVWWGLFLIALSAPANWWTIVSPLIMTFLLTRISGVPMLERHLRRSRPGYDDYCRRTSAFFPLPPRRGAGSS